MPEQKEKGLLTQQQFLAVFGVEPGTMQRFIKFGMPVEEGKKFDLVQVGQWIVRHLQAGYLSLEQTAEMFNQEVRTITKWKNEFGMPQAAPGFYKRDDVVKWRVSFLEKKIKTLQQGGSDGVSANTKLKTAQAARQEIRLQKEMGKVVDIDIVIPVFEKQYALIAQRKKLFAKRTNPQLEGLEYAEREKILERNTDELFNNIYESTIEELNRIRELYIANKGNIESSQAAPAVDSKRTRKRKKNSKSRNRK
jgi:phage terminase Nu1 subunit (DNA packaging protein)